MQRVLRVSVNILKDNHNAVRTCRAFGEGIKRQGDVVDYRTDRDHNVRGYHAVVLWGFVQTCQDLIAQCVEHHVPYVFMDMAYWARDTYYKVSVNDRHPTAYLMKKPQPRDRFHSLGLAVKPMQVRKTGNIILAGMSGKAAWAWSFGPEQFEKETALQLQKLTGRPIIYRPKPNWSGATGIPGTKFDKTTPLERVWKDTYCVVTHHSNVGCGALLEGVPVFSKRGAASVLGRWPLDQLENPLLTTPPTREQWASNLAYCQWSLKEMDQGLPWGHLKKEGLV